MGDTGVQKYKKKNILKIGLLELEKRTSVRFFSLSFLYKSCPNFPLFSENGTVPCGFFI
jgi:hypothetical protein